jgi:hypothetical protein
MNLKNWKTWVTGTLIVLCVAAPYIWDGCFNSHHYPIDWQAWWAFCTFAVAVAAAVIAYNEYNNHLASAAHEEQQRKEDYLLQIRPYITVRLILERRTYFLEIKNLGKTPGENVKVTLDERILELYPEDNLAHSLLSNMLRRTITLVAPDQRYIFFICTPQNKKDYIAKGDSVQFEGTVSYENRDHVNFKENFQLDFEDYSYSVEEAESPLVKISNSITKNTSAINALERSIVTHFKHQNDGQS